MCLCYMYCVLIRLVDKTQEETLIISILLIFTVTPVTMLIVFHRPLFDQFSANNFMISQKFVVLVFRNAFILVFIQKMS